jgi:metallo-beta-lactamase family protein
MSHLLELSRLLDASSSPKETAASVSPSASFLPDLSARPDSPLFYRPFGACGSVTGSAHFVYHAVSGKCFAVECGLLQGEGDPCANDVASLPVHPRELHAIFLTHAHTDHVGNLFVWLRAGFRGKIYCTDVTARLTVISLRDAMNPDRQPVEEGDEALWDLLPTLFVCPDRHSNANDGHLYPVEGADGLRYAFTATSHLVGCVALRLLSTSKGQPHADIVFSGDIGPVTDAATHGGLSPARGIPTSLSGVVVLESTYGDREDRAPATLCADNRLTALAAVIKAAVEKGPQARLIIPAFSLGRTTDLLADLFVVLATMRGDAGLSVDSVPAINVESQLASAFADVLREAYAAKKGTGAYAWLNSDSRLIKLGGLPLLQRLLSPKAEPRQEHDTRDGKLVVNWGQATEGQGLTVFIAGSGTSLHGRVCREIMEHAKNPQATLLLCGYCPENSLGSRIRAISALTPVERSKLPPLSLRLRDGPGGKSRFWEEPADAVKIHLADLSSYYSGHADSGSLMRYASGLRKSADQQMDFILVHGTNRARAQLSEKLKSDLGDDCKVREVHSPSNKFPWFDVAAKKWCFDDLGVLRSSLRVNVRESLGDGVSARDVASALARKLAQILNMIRPAVETDARGARFNVRGRSSEGGFFHDVLVVDLGSGDFDLRVDSRIGHCQTNDEFKDRCFPWERAAFLLDRGVSLGYLPVATDQEVVELLATLRDPCRDYPVLLVTKLGNDNTCAKFLSKSLMLESGIVRLVTLQGRAVGRELGLDLQSGVGLFFDERPGMPPVPFSLLNPLDSAKALLDCLNRLENARRGGEVPKMGKTGL